MVGVVHVAAVTQVSSKFIVKRTSGLSRRMARQGRDVGRAILDSTVH
jgi:hypothetical protein